jgi:membrane fusion protein, multidrug efflux system
VLLTLRTEPRAIVVPSGAVQAGPQGQYVYVIKADRTVESRSVTVARAQDDESVIASGLAPGEQVVTDGQLRLVPGKRVTVQPLAAAAGKGQS